MRRKSVTPIEIGAKAADHAQIAFLGGGDQFSGEITPVEELALPVERNLGGIKRNDAGDRSKNHIALEAGPIVSPFLDVEDSGGRVMLRAVDLPGAADLLMPGDIGAFRNIGQYPMRERSCSNCGC